MYGYDFKGSNLLDFVEFILLCDYGIFAQDYLTQVDPTASLGLSGDSLHSYQLAQGGHRVIGGDKPQASPCHCLGSGPARIFVTLKGQCPVLIVESKL